MKISYGNSRMAKRWDNGEISWSDFSTRCSQTLKTHETLTEFMKMKPTEAEGIKDHGGFVLGELKDGMRNAQSVISRSAIALDMDFGKSNVYDDVISKLPCRLLVYSTHKNSPEKPRLRIIIPLSRDIMPQEYEPVARKLAEQIGIEMFDPTTYQNYRLMYWPTTPKDQEFFFRSKDGAMADPDKILAQYSDWQDCEQWPRSSRERAKAKALAKKQEDPHTKKGWVGTFCRAYTITEAIEKFLPEIYEPTDNPERWHFCQSSSTAGALIYDEKFLYSNHAKDPACNRLLNAFDLVRTHLYGELDGDADINAKPGSLKSFQKMCEMASLDPKVKKQKFEESREDLADEFEDSESDLCERLETDSKGNYLATAANISLIIQFDPALQSIVWNEFTTDFDVIGPVPWNKTETGWTDADLSALKIFIEKHYGIWNASKVFDCLQSVTRHNRSWHPVKEYLENLEYKGQKAAERLWIDYLGADDNEYIRTVTRKTLLAAVSRIFEPGIKHDTMPILVGPPGIGKSTMVKLMAVDWYSDSIRVEHFKDPKLVGEQLFNSWIAEVPEYNINRPEMINYVKAALSSQNDRFRKAYGRATENHPRQSIFIATSNQTSVLADDTGNRRFQIVQCHGGKLHPWDLPSIDDIWAEVMHWYHTGTEDLFLSSEMEKVAETYRTRVLESDDRLGLIQEFLNTPIPSNYDEMDLYSRRNYFDGTEFGSPSKDGNDLRDTCCPLQIWAECFGMDPSKITSNDSRKIGLMIEKTGEWRRYTGNSEGKLRFRPYGKQKAFERIPRPIQRDTSSDIPSFLEA